MAEPATAKDALLLAAAREYKAFHEALHGLNEEQMGEVWLGTWSMKEIVAHITGWHREMVPALERLADRSHEDLMLAADRVPAERFEAGRTAHRLVDANSAHHYREHAEQVLAWRTSREI